MHRTIVLALASVLPLLVCSVASAQAGAALNAPEPQLEVEAEPPSTGYPAQRPDYERIPAPGSYGAQLGESRSPRALSPNGPTIIALRRRIAREQEALDSIETGWPMGFFFGGLATCAAGGLTSLMGMVALDGTSLWAGVGLAAAGGLTWIVSLIVWRVFAHQRRDHQRNLDQYQFELNQALGGGPMPAPGFRF